MIFNNKTDMSLEDLNTSEKLEPLTIMEIKKRCINIGVAPSTGEMTYTFIQAAVSVKANE